MFGAQHAALTLTADVIKCLVHNMQHLHLQQTSLSVWCTTCSTYTYSRRHSVFGAQHAALTLTADVIKCLVHNMQHLHLQQTSLSVWCTTCNTYTYSRRHYVCGAQHATLTLTADVIMCVVHNMQHLQKTSFAVLTLNSLSCPVSEPSCKLKCHGYTTCRGLHAFDPLASSIVGRERRGRRDCGRGQSMSG